MAEHAHAGLGVSKFTMGAAPTFRLVYLTHRGLMSTHYKSAMPMGLGGRGFIISTRGSSLVANELASQLLSCAITHLRYGREEELFDELK